MGDIPKGCALSDCYATIISIEGGGYTWNDFPYPIKRYRYELDEAFNKYNKMNQKGRFEDDVSLVRNLRLLQAGTLKLVEPRFRS